MRSWLHDEFISEIETWESLLPISFGLLTASTLTVAVRLIKSNLLKRYSHQQKLFAKVNSIQLGPSRKAQEDTQKFKLQCIFSNFWFVAFQSKSINPPVQSSSSSPHFILSPNLLKRGGGLLLALSWSTSAKLASLSTTDGFLSCFPCWGEPLLGTWVTPEEELGLLEEGPKLKKG